MLVVLALHRNRRRWVHAFLHFLVIRWHSLPNPNDTASLQNPEGTSFPAGPYYFWTIFGFFGQSCLGDNRISEFHSISTEQNLTHRGSSRRRMEKEGQEQFLCFQSQSAEDEHQVPILF